MMQTDSTNSQRFCSQHQVKVGGKIEKIFLTQLHADTLGGLLGMYLTLADGGTHRLAIHGPPGVSHFLSAGKVFCENREDSEMRAAEISLQNPRESLVHDNFVSIQPVPIIMSDLCNPFTSHSPGATAATATATAPSNELKVDFASDDNAEDEEGGVYGGGGARVEGGEGGRVKIERNRRNGVEGLYGSTAVSYVLRFADEVRARGRDRETERQRESGRERERARERQRESKRDRERAIETETETEKERVMQSLIYGQLKVPNVWLQFNHCAVRMMCVCVCVRVCVGVGVCVRESVYRRGREAWGVL